MGLWYTAVANAAGGKVVTLSGPYESEEEADYHVAEPGSRDRRCAEALDAKAVFYHYLTVELSTPSTSVVLRTPKALRILNRKGWCFWVKKTPAWFLDADDTWRKATLGTNVAGWRGPFKTRREACEYGAVQAEEFTEEVMG